MVYVCTAAPTEYTAQLTRRQTFSGTVGLSELAQATWLNCGRGAGEPTHRYSEEAPIGAVSTAPGGHHRLPQAGVALPIALRHACHPAVRPAASWISCPSTREALLHMTKR